MEREVAVYGDRSPASIWMMTNYIHLKYGSAMTHRRGGGGDHHEPKTRDYSVQRQHYGLLRDQLAFLVRRRSWLTIMTTTVSPNLTHHGQNRDQKTGATGQEAEK